MVFSSRVRTSPARRSGGEFVHVGVEFEVTCRMGADLPADRGPHTRESVADAIATCAASYELIEDRNADYETLEAAALVADNCWNGGVVLGAPVGAWRGVDLGSARTALLP